MGGVERAADLREGVLDRDHRREPGILRRGREGPRRGDDGMLQPQQFLPSVGTRRRPEARQRGFEGVTHDESPHALLEERTLGQIHGGSGPSIRRTDDGSGCVPTQLHLRHTATNATQNRRAIRDRGDAWGCLFEAVANDGI